jgi:hypothetical protein
VAQNGGTLDTRAANQIASNVNPAEQTVRLNRSRAGTHATLNSAHGEHPLELATGENRTAQCAHPTLHRRARCKSSADSHGADFTARDDRTRAYALVAKQRSPNDRVS